MSNNLLGHLPIAAGCMDRGAFSGEFFARALLGFAGAELTIPPAQPTPSPLLTSKMKPLSN
jgi:hypothetical protein